MAEVHGSCDERFAGVREALARQLDGEELGASVAVDLDGDTVVDLWGGYRDEARTRPWSEHTVVNVWSTTKCVLSLAALMLVDRGELDLDAPVGDYWPEFCAKGKKGVLVRHLLSHTSGVSGWEQPFSIRDMYDWTSATERLAQQKPWWEPGTASGYHANNQGHLVGEVIRRVTGTTFKKFVADRIADPLGADFQIGARESEVSRIAPVVAPPRPDVDPRTLDPESVSVKTFTGPTASAKAANSPEWRAADLGALNGHSNARGVMRVLRTLSLGGEAGGVRLLSPETVEQVFDVQADGVDLVLGAPFRWGTGFCLGSPTVPYVPEGRTFFWGGWGGSLVVMDLDRRLTISYMMNRMGSGLIGSPRSEAYVRAVYEALR
ncbi:serine hydrolase domain-containing protein [Blastococcus xanthinilyticus]|uniref:CubicO group peptidase (Beta-lactamase class C family) n=1 Tax=Blastococcus xanthinilyticus TaxID=1564164 RepID=A0A5S5CVJ7_9ACTN|nr:serine hydrolase domain-containing protein [Blastococcus xanthinilyticus]TYP86572.1 CubicO group peptidase (beta-lactamase class C family) [Blastococcus xanthinilyticus]